MLGGVARMQRGRARGSQQTRVLRGWGWIGSRGPGVAVIVADRDDLLFVDR